MDNLRISATDCLAEPAPKAVIDTAMVRIELAIADMRHLAIIDRTEARASACIAASARAQ